MNRGLDLVPVCPREWTSPLHKADAFVLALSSVFFSQNWLQDFLLLDRVLESVNTLQLEAITKEVGGGQADSISLSHRREKNALRCFKGIRT